MIESVKAAVTRYNMFNDEKSVTVALSGGADSVALLYALLSVKDEYGLSITAAHLNHCLRGEESDGDEAYVRRLCDSLGVPLTVESAEISKVSEITGESVELAARRVRYEFLERVSNGLIATAHTADDNAETVLYNLARGTGLKGVCGIPPKRGRIVRPLIMATRQQVEEFCTANGLEFRTDSTNLTDDYARNRIRHNAVPALKSVNSAATRNIACFSRRVAEDESLLSDLANREFSRISKDGGVKADELNDLHPALKCRVVALLAQKELNVCLEHTNIECIFEMLSRNGVKQSVKNDCFAVIVDGVLKFVRSIANPQPFDFAVEALPFSEKSYELSVISAENFKKMATVNSLLLKSAIDCDKICGKLRFRSRLPGDSIRLMGRGCTKTFKNLFNESKIDSSLRDSLPVLCDDKGVLWLAEFGADERAAVDADTKNVILIKNGGTFSEQV